MYLNEMVPPHLAGTLVLPASCHHSFQVLSPWVSSFDISPRLCHLIRR